MYLTRWFFLPYCKFLSRIRTTNLLGEFVKTNWTFACGSFPLLYFVVGEGKKRLIDGDGRIMERQPQLCYISRRCSKRQGWKTGCSSNVALHSSWYEEGRWWYMLKEIREDFLLVCWMTDDVIHFCRIFFCAKFVLYKNTIQNKFSKVIWSFIYYAEYKYILNDACIFCVVHDDGKSICVVRLTVMTTNCAKRTNFVSKSPRTTYLLIMIAKAHPLRFNFAQLRNFRK